MSDFISQILNGIEFKGVKFDNPNKLKGKIVAETFNPFEWFPELEKMFENFDIERMDVKMKDSCFVIMRCNEDGNF